MKTFAVAATAAVALTAAPVQAWWDNGHMLVGQVATQLMKPADVAVIEKVLSAWEADFPNTAKIATASIWPDLVKCSSQSAFCNTSEIPAVNPSFAAMDKWHYVNLPLFASGARWGNAEPDLNLFTSSWGGDAGDVGDMFMRTLNSSRSLWSANLALRQLIHILGDVHNPMHAVGAVDEKNPAGDSGGNNFRFDRNCVATAANLHALYDAVGGAYVENWSPKFDTETLVANATALIKSLPIIEDTASMDSITSLPYGEFYTKLNTDRYFKKFILESYNTAINFVYPELNKAYFTIPGRSGNFIPCPPAWYIEWAAELSKLRIAIAGKRLGVLLTKISERLRVNFAQYLAN